MSLNPAERIAVDLVWQHFSATGTWPDRHVLLLALDDAGWRLHDAHQVLSSVTTHTSYESPSSELAGLSLRGWAAVPEVADLLRPLGQVVRRLVARFVAEPTPPEFHAEGIAWSVFKDLWPAEADWRRISQIVHKGLAFPLNYSSQQAEEIYLRPNLQMLAYERVETFEDIIRVSGTIRPRQRVGRHPAGAHRDFLRRVFAYATRDHAWPRAALFAVRERDLGPVADIQRDLASEKFVRSEFSGHGEIELGLDAVVTVDDSGAGRALLLRVLAECRSRWRSAPARDVAVADLATALGAEEATLRPWLLFLGSAAWLSGRTLSRNEPWVIRPNELVLRYSNIDQWDDFIAAPALHRAADFGYLDTERPSAQDASPMALDLSQSRARLARLLRDPQLTDVISARLEELSRVFSVGAWQSALFLLGSAMEGVLLDVLSRNEGKAETVLPQRRRTSRLEDSGLGDLLIAAEELNLVNGHVRAMAAGVKEFRDLIHPFRATASNHRATAEAVRASAIAFENMVVEMDQAIDDGRMAAFES